MIAVASASRSPRGFRLTNIRAEFWIPPPPTYASTVATPGSLHDDVDEPRHALLHRLERCVLVGLNRSRQTPRCPAAGKNPFGIRT